MNRLAVAVTTLALTAVLAGCGDNSKPPSSPATPAAPTSAAPTPIRYAWGQPGEIIGVNGNALRITPLGVLYDKGPYSGTEGPENGWFVAISLKGEAVGQADATAAPISGGGFMWQGDGEKISEVDGNATSTPWVGTVNEFSNVPIQPGEPELAVQTFDVPSKGGRLIYVNPDLSIVSWDLPSTAQGTGLDKVRKRIKEFQP